MKTGFRVLTIVICALFLVASSALFADAARGETVRIGVCGRTEPLLFINDNGSPVGLFVDLMDRIAEMQDLRVEYVIYRVQRQAMHDLMEKEIDAVLGAIPYDIETFSDIVLSEEIFNTSICYVTTKDFEWENGDSEGAFELGTVSYDKATLMQAESYSAFSTQEQVYNYLVGDSNRQAMMVRDCLRYMLARDGLGNDYRIIMNNAANIAYSIALRGDNLFTNDQINSAINKLRLSEDYRIICDKWGITTELDEANIRYDRLLRWIAPVMILAVLTIGTILLFNQKLRSMVREKTAELSETVEDLQVSSALRDSLIEHSSTGSVLLNLDGTILLMNDTLREMAGLDKDATVANINELGMIGKAWNMAKDDMEQSELIEERSADGKLHKYRYQRHRTANHDERVFMIEDVTREENERQEVFEESKNKALNRIIAGISHEIKNPLMTIKNYAVLSETEMESEDFRRSFSQYVPKEVDRISLLIESLIAYSRPVRGQKERFNVGDVADSCRGLAYVASKKGVEIKSDIDRGCFITANKDQFRQSLLNFLINSVESIEKKMIEFSDHESDQYYVKLTVRRDGGNVVTEVYDNGVGMSEEQLSRCTEPFYTTKSSGTGMGLALASQYTRENGGHFEIDSIENKFTCVRMTFAEDSNDEQAGGMGYR